MSEGLFQPINARKRSTFFNEGQSLTELAVISANSRTVVQSRLVSHLVAYRFVGLKSRHIETMI
jgi:hypothetical protein